MIIKIKNKSDAIKKTNIKSVNCKEKNFNKIKKKSKE